jgi:hypothetical protein
MLSISIYIGKDFSALQGQPFGNHERAFLYEGVPDYSEVVSMELSGEYIDKLSPIRDDRGQMLLLGKPLFL